MNKLQMRKWNEVNTVNQRSKEIQEKMQNMKSSLYRLIEEVEDAETALARDGMKSYVASRLSSEFANFYRNLDLPFFQKLVSELIAAEDMVELLEEVEEA